MHPPLHILPYTSPLTRGPPLGPTACTRPSHLLPAPQAHHLVNDGARVNQRDGQGWAPLHRAAVLAHLDGYLELYEYLLVGGYTVKIRG